MYQVSHITETNSYEILKYLVENYRNIHLFNDKITYHKPISTALYTQVINSKLSPSLN